MLVLSRRDGEQILVGDDVVISVLSVAHGRVRVGIEAPRNIPVRRSEILSQPRNVPADPPCSDWPTRLTQSAGTVH